MSQIRTYKTVTIANGAAISGEIDMTYYSGFSVTLPSAWTAANIGIKTSHVSGGTFTPVYDIDGTVLEIASPAVSKTYVFPELGKYAGKIIKLWSQDGSGNDTNQGAARTLTVQLVS